MKCYIEYKPICPLVNKPCISDGVTFEVLHGKGVAHPCEFWDETIYNGVIPEEPCRIKRAISRLLADETPDRVESGYKADVPWTNEKE